MNNHCVHLIICTVQDHNSMPFEFSFWARREYFSVFMIKTNECENEQMEIEQMEVQLVEGGDWILFSIQYLD